GFISLLSPELLEGNVGTLLKVGIVTFGASGLLLGIAGAIGLIHRRMVVWELREYSAPADFFNLIVFVLAFGVALVGFLLLKLDFFEGVTAMVSNMMAFQLVPLTGNGVAAMLPLISAVLMSLLLAYIPLTHMSHFVGKYFAYHSIRWNDDPNLPGSGKEGAIKKALGQHVSWSAPHIKGDGKKTWVDLATKIPEKEEKKK
ncbi:MAG: respiratory nitrate reductase subunit gamma, partial [bacterium]